MSSKTAQVRSAVIGAGMIGRVHSWAVHAAGGRLVSVLSRNGREPDLARKARAERETNSLAELVEADDIDVVHICTPNDSHVELALRVIESGKHVICEKPIATTLDDARELTAAAEEAAVIAAVPFVYRFHPNVRETRARMARGDAGRLWLMHGSYLQDWLSRATDRNWRVDPAKGGVSRAFGDIGVHWCDLMEFVTGHRIARLSARFGSAFEARIGTEDGSVVMFETDRGAIGSLVVSQVSPGRKNRLWFSFDGTEASFSFDQETPDRLWVGGREDTRLIMRSPELASSFDAARLSQVPSGHTQGYREAFAAFVGDVYAAISGEHVEGLPTFADGLRAAVLTDAVVQSNATSSWKEIPT